MNHASRTSGSNSSSFPSAHAAAMRRTRTMGRITMNPKVSSLLSCSPRAPVRATRWMLAASSSPHRFESPKGHLQRPPATCSAVIGAWPASCAGARRRWWRERSPMSAHLLVLEQRCCSFACQRRRVTNQGRSRAPSTAPGRRALPSRLRAIMEREVDVRAVHARVSTGQR